MVIFVVSGGYCGIFRQVSSGFVAFNGVFCILRQLLMCSEVYPASCGRSRQRLVIAGKFLTHWWIRGPLFGFGCLVVPYPG
jgi:hypothetical protein